MKSLMSKTFKRKLVLFLAFASSLFLVLHGPLAASKIAEGPKESPQSQSVLSLLEKFGIASSHLPLCPPSVVEAELNAVAEAQIQWVRCVFAWSDMQPNPGQWIFTGTDRVVEMCRARKIRILGILLASPPWANGGRPWNYPPSDMQAWYNYVFTVCSRYRGKVSAWEIWNEQNIHAFWMPDPDPVQYVNLLSVASSAIRAADPSAKVVMGGVAGLDPAFLNQCLAAGAHRYIDALAYHPYPETLQQNNFKPQEEHCRNIVAFVRWLISVYTSRPIEVWITEFGWTTCPASPPGVGEHTQAAYILRSFLNYSKTDINMVFLHSLRDDLLTEYEYYGILRNDFSKKPSFGYYKNFNVLYGESQLALPGLVQVSCSFPGDLEEHHVLLPDGSLVVSLWNSEDNQDSANVEIADQRYREPLTVDMGTGVQSPTPNVSRGPDGRLRISALTIGRNPVVLRFARLTAPYILSVTPEVCDPGGLLTINGFNFGAQQGTGAVYFGTTKATEYTSWSNNTVVVRVPIGLVPGSHLVKVVTPEGESNVVAVKVFGILSIKPDYGVSGTVVDPFEITGAGFRSGAAVRIQRDASIIHGRDVVFVSDEKIRCKLDLGGAPLGKYDVIVSNPDGKEAKAAQAFRVTNACGGGAAISLALFGMTFWLVSMVGAGLNRKKTHG